MNANIRCDMIQILEVLGAKSTDSLPGVIDRVMRVLDLRVVGTAWSRAQVEEACADLLAD